MNSRPFISLIIQILLHLIVPNCIDCSKYEQIMSKAKMLSQQDWRGFIIGSDSIKMFIAVTRGHLCHRRENCFIIIKSILGNIIVQRHMHKHVKKVALIEAHLIQHTRNTKRLHLLGVSLSYCVWCFVHSGMCVGISVYPSTQMCGMQLCLKVSVYTREDYPQGDPAQLGRTNKLCVFLTVGSGTGPDQ